MKVKYLTAVIVVLFVATGCKTTKQATSISRTANNETATERKSDTTGNQQIAVVTQQSDNGKVDETTGETAAIVEFSPPDSTGRQYPLKSITVTRTVRRSENKDINYKQNENTNAGITISNSEKLQTKTDSTKKENNNIKTESKAPSGVSWGMAILTVGLLVLVYLVLKKYKML